MDFIIKNNSCVSQDKLSKSWAMYKFKCPNEDCELLNPLYIGQTRNTIKRRLEQHQKDRAIKEHMEKSTTLASRHKIWKITLFLSNPSKILNV